MHFRYRTCSIDATPDFSVGRYFARVRIELSPEACERMGAETTYESADLADFSDEAEAVAHAHQWAIGWIDKHLAAVTSTSDEG